MIDTIIEQISKINTLDDYIEFEGKKYGKPDNIIEYKKSNVYPITNNI